jgi:predicted CoA-binding protein
MPTIAVIGASSDRRKFGNKCVRAYLQRGYRVFPINPNESEIEGLAAFKSIREVPVDSVDRVSVYLPPAIGVKVLDEIAQKKTGQVWLNPGADAPAVVSRARELGLNVIAGCSIVDVGVSPHELSET